VLGKTSIRLLCQELILASCDNFKGNRNGNLSNITLDFNFIIQEITVIPMAIKLLALLLPTIKDAYNNTVSDGTMVVFHIATKTCFKTFWHYDELTQDKFFIQTTWTVMP
jgi:hypothetical protein